ncbi:hypothetical protein RM531_01240 [Salinisphaera sp. P385]|uniref:Lipoprotein n=1 Tax=Spectribacter acetivorans TaxID=3075603 RepID=A0ABU3B4W1_9GAMM|nr:hypothetical protein [Salinisphaera sp. P385]MDT0617090.1 hypothetical protein [Salinisphaera sp. P385]
MIRLPARLVPAALLCALLIACSGATPTSQRAAFITPGSGGQAVIEFTSNRLDINAMGGEAGVGTMGVHVKPSFCAGASQPVGGLKRISASQRMESLSVPAGEPLVVEAFWQSGDRHCFITQRAFTAQAGAVYRMTQQVNTATSACQLQVSQQQRTGQYRYLGRLQTIKQACSFSRR